MHVTVQSVCVCVPNAGYGPRILTVLKRSVRVRVLVLVRRSCCGFAVRRTASVSVEPGTSRAGDTYALTSAAICGLYTNGLQCFYGLCSVSEYTIAHVLERDIDADFSSAADMPEMYTFMLCGISHEISVLFTVIDIPHSTYRLTFHISHLVHNRMLFNCRSISYVQNYT